MFKSKKLLLIMALILCFVCLTACGGGGDDVSIDEAPTGTPQNPNAGVGDAATADKVDPNDENAPQGAGAYTEIAAVVTKVSGSTVSYDIYGYITDAADAEEDTIMIKDRVFEKTVYTDSFTAENPDTFSVSIYNAASETIDASSFADIAKGDILILLTDSETKELTGVIIYPAE